MRIISGSHKGRIIETPKNFRSRPTTDRAKESLFNILANIYDFERMTVLDLFAGTGSISYEFASRGAVRITAVEIIKKYADFIQYNSDKIFGQGTINVINADVFKYLKNTTLDYKVIFADPPYDLENIKEIPDLVFENTTLKDDALLIVEHSVRTNFSDNKFLRRQRKYGKVVFSFFSKEDFL